MSPSNFQLEHQTSVVVSCFHPKIYRGILDLPKKYANPNEGHKMGMEFLPTFRSLRWKITIFHRRYIDSFMVGFPAIVILVNSWGGTYI